MTKLNSVTYGVNVSSHTIVPDQDINRHVASSLFKTVFELLKPAPDSASNVFIGEETHAFITQAAPDLIGALEQVVRDQPAGARNSVRIALGDDRIAISETEAGLEIEDEVSGDVEVVHGQDFRSLLQVLIRNTGGDEQYAEVEHRPGDVFPLLALQPELRQEIVTHLDDNDAIALGCANRSLYDEAGDQIEALASSLMVFDGLDAMRRALDTIADLPGSFQMGTLTALAEDAALLTPSDRALASSAISEAAHALQPNNQSQLLSMLGIDGPVVSNSH